MGPVAEHRHPVLATVVEVADGTALVDWRGNPAGRPVPALTTAKLPGDAADRTAVIIFAEGDAARPVVVGLIESPATSAPPPAIEAKLDGERVMLQAAHEIVLSCGAATITLTRAGKGIIRGAYISSRSSGVHRIKGAAVEIN